MITAMVVLALLFILVVTMSILIGVLSDDEEPVVYGGLLAAVIGLALSILTFIVFAQSQS